MTARKKAAPLEITGADIEAALRDIEVREVETLAYIAGRPDPQRPRRSAAEQWLPRYRGVKGVITEAIASLDIALQDEDYARGILLRVAAAGFVLGRGASDAKRRNATQINTTILDIRMRLEAEARAAGHRPKAVSLDMDAAAEATRELGRPISASRVERVRLAAKQRTAR